MHLGVGVGWGWGLLPITTYTGRGHSKGVPFLGFNERVDIIFTTVVEV